MEREGKTLNSRMIGEGYSPIAFVKEDNFEKEFLDLLTQKLKGNYCKVAIVPFDLAVNGFDGTFENGYNSIFYAVKSPQLRGKEERDKHFNLHMTMSLGYKTTEGYFRSVNVEEI